MSDQDASKDTVPTMIFVEDNEQEDHDPEQQRTWKVKKPISSSHKHRAQNLVLFCFFCAAFLTVIVVGAGAYILLDTTSRMKKNHDDSNNSEDSYEFPIDRIDDLIRFNNTFNPALPHRNIFNTTAP
ncbi:unnamed protein product [Cylindrotheca closterium]|uniref:Uncharacterized protein n=1 Tax=Cylindrotheca closterium TaxID=2856 RepID=A0AAD2CET0_9STRA|nr:unnamed protein product [Cylindrotheca closterium]